MFREFVNEIAAFVVSQDVSGIQGDLAKERTDRVRKALEGDSSIRDQVADLIESHLHRYLDSFRGSERNEVHNALKYTYLYLNLRPLLQAGSATTGISTQALASYDTVRDAFVLYIMQGINTALDFFTQALNQSIEEKGEYDAMARARHYLEKIPTIGALLARHMNVNHIAIATRTETSPFMHGHSTNGQQALDGRSWENL